MEEIAAELPLIAICRLMGVPIDRRQHLFELTNIMLGMTDPELSTSEADGENAMAHMFFLAHELALAHRDNPQDDIVHVLPNGTVEDEPLTDEEFCHFFLMLMVAGNKTDAHGDVARHATVDETSRAPPDAGGQPGTVGGRYRGSVAVLIRRSSRFAAPPQPMLS
ncbi:MAG: hypothetical protein IPG06_22360 [Haliea sp.]|nr:hypothetical protein [Haliea sp.]